MLESGEVMVLPKGWTTRQSKTNDGKTYYVNPYGHTQWLRPPMKTGADSNAGLFDHAGLTRLVCMCVCVNFQVSRIIGSTRLR